MTDERSFTRRSAGSLLLLLSAFYLFFALHDGYHLYPDSASYLEMSISREPLYPLFLALVRSVFARGGEELFLRAAVVIQSLITALASWFFVLSCLKCIPSGKMAPYALGGCTLLPALLCRFLANRRSLYSCSILSEALAMPLYLVFFALVLLYAVQGRRRDLLLAFFVSFLLISLRKQMAVCLPVAVFAALLRGLRERRRWHPVLISLLLSAAVLLGCSALDRGYNAVLRGTGQRHTGDMRFISTMIFYCAEEEDAAYLEDAELRTLYTDIFREAEENGYNHHFAPADWFSRSLFFENNYDNIQYNCLRKCILASAGERFGDNELLIAREADRIYDAFNSALLRPCWTRLLRLAADSVAVGLVRSVATMKKPLLPAAALLYALYLGLLAVCLRKKERDAALLGLLALASTGATNALVSLTIFCQARYVLYNMPLLYAALLLMALRCRTRGREER